MILYEPRKVKFSRFSLYFTLFNTNYLQGKNKVSTFASEINNKGMDNKTRMVLMNLFGEDYTDRLIHCWKDGEFILCLRKSVTGMELYKIIPKGTEEYGFYNDERPQIIGFIKLTDDFNINELRNVIKR